MGLFREERREGALEKLPGWFWQRLTDDCGGRRGLMDDMSSTTAKVDRCDQAGHSSVSRLQYTDDRTWFALVALLEFRSQPRQTPIATPERRGVFARRI